MARRILVVEDEAPIREMVCFVLEQNGFQPVEAEDYDSAVNQLNEPWPDLILLDWMLPGGSGLQFIKLLKREAMTRDIPVVMLTARGEEEDRVRGLETGADDYITKPFSPKELVARIKAVMRRISPMAVEEVIEMQGLSLDPSSHRVRTGESPLDMGPTEFKLLHFFMTHPERVYSREQLLNHVWWAPPPWARAPSRAARSACRTFAPFAHFTGHLIPSLFVKHTIIICFCRIRGMITSPS